MPGKARCSAATLTQATREFHEALAAQKNSRDDVAPRSLPGVGLAPSALSHPTVYRRRPLPCQRPLSLAAASSLNRPPPPPHSPRQPFFVRSTRTAASIWGSSPPAAAPGPIWRK